MLLEGDVEQTSRSELKLKIAFINLYFETFTCFFFHEIYTEDWGASEHDVDVSPKNVAELLKLWVLLLDVTSTTSMGIGGGVWDEEQQTKEDGVTSCQPHGQRLNNLVIFSATYEKSFYKSEGWHIINEYNTPVPKKYLFCCLLNPYSPSYSE